MISRAAEYALRTLVCMARDASHPASARQLASATGVPASYQAKVLQALRRARIVRAQRGPGGGFVLARPADALTVQAVIEAVDPPQTKEWLAPESVPLDALRQRLRDGVGMIETLFRTITIAELCEDRATPRNRDSDQSQGNPLRGNAR